MMRVFASLAAVAVVVLGLGGHPAAALTIDFGQAPVPEGPSASLLVQGVDITGSQQNGTFVADVQRNAKGVGVAVGNNTVQDDETVVLDFGSAIVLQSFALWFSDASAFPDPFSVEIGDSSSSTAVSVAATNGPFVLLPPANVENSGAGRWFTFDVAGTPTGSVLEFTGGLSSSFRVKNVTYIPEPASALLVGMGLLGLASRRFRNHR
jgi:hypothetical protein